MLVVVTCYWFLAVDIFLDGFRVVVECNGCRREMLKWHRYLLHTVVDF